MNLKLKRFCAYLVDYMFIVLIVSSISQLNFINPYLDEYYEVYEEYSKYTEDNLEINAFSLLGDKEYQKLFFEVSKYGIVVNVVSIICYLLYFVGFQKWNKNQTLGKKLFGVEVVSQNGKNVTWKQMFLRTIIVYNLLFNAINTGIVLFVGSKMFVNVSMFLNILANIVTYGTIIMILIRKDGKGLHDLVCGTNVDYVKKAL